MIRNIFDPNTRQWRGGGGYGIGDPWITFGSFLDHFRPFCCGLVHHFLEAKLLEQVNLHFWIIYNTLLALYLHYVRRTYVWKLRFWIIFVNMIRWIISFLELTFLDHIFSTQIGGSSHFRNSANQK